MRRGVGLKWSLLWVVCNAVASSLVAQPEPNILTYPEYLENILRFHPVARQAELKLQLGDAERLKAKGKLDPKFISGWDQKRFDDQLYYNNFKAKLKIPTPLGIDVVGGYEHTDGLYVNPENTTKDYGLWQLGLEVDILQGLVVNERKTALQKAQTFQQLNANERQIMINDLIYGATVAYLNWQQYTDFNDIREENIRLAYTYFQSTRDSYRSGEKTAMDTLEAFIAYQEAVTQKQKNQLDLVKARMYVENNLWYEDQPVTLQDETQPEPYPSQVIPVEEVAPDTLMATHPVILAAVNKLSILEIEQRLKREAFKPRLTLRYSPLIATGNAPDVPDFSIDDYKLGMNLTMPLIWRSERAEVQAGELKIMDTQLDLDYKRNELQNKIRNSWEQQMLLQSQLGLLTANVDSYKRLLDGEQEKFNLGESSVFLLNKRQEKYIEGQMKMVETNIKRQLETLNLLYLSNRLVEE